MNLRRITTKTGNSELKLQTEIVQKEILLARYREKNSVQEAVCTATRIVRSKREYLLPFTKSLPELPEYRFISYIPLCRSTVCCKEKINLIISNFELF